jgi:hypothetical protein
MEVLENMLVLDTLRGLDSTGVFGVDRNRQVGIMKIASNPFHLFACDAWTKMKNKLVQNGRIAIGHNRKATQGSINSANAHPFNENNIVLVHNGTLRGGHKKLADTEVDSHAVCHAFSEKGAEAVIPTIDGAFAFVWWDMEKGKLMAIRNDERPLNMILTNDLVVLASEPWMAHATLERSNKKVVETIPLEVGLLYEFDLNGKYTTKKIPLFEGPIYMGTNCDPKKAMEVSQPDGGGRNLTLIKSCTQNFDTTVSRQFPHGKEVLLKLWNFEASERKTHIRVTGKVVSPSLPAIDFVCNVTTTASPNKCDDMMVELANMMDGYVLGTVSSFSSSSCGPSIFVHNLRPDLKIQTHNGLCSAGMWNHVVAQCKCKHCSARIYDEEAAFTIVELRSPSDMTVVCADCVEDKLPLGDFKNEFNQRRNAALQIGESVSDSSVDSTLHLPSKPNSPTVH